jgi:hypothetical protein
MSGNKHFMLSPKYRKEKKIILCISMAGRIKKSCWMVWNYNLTKYAEIKRIERDTFLYFFKQSPCLLKISPHRRSSNAAFDAQAAISLGMTLGRIFWYTASTLQSQLSHSLPSLTIMSPLIYMTPN